MRPEPCEQPRCEGCGHRRIFHTHLNYEERMSRTGGRRCVGESMVPCSLPGCDCREYRPRSSPGQSAIPAPAGNRPQLVR